MRKSGLTGDEAYILSKRGKTTEDLGPLKKELGQLKEDLDNRSELVELNAKGQENKVWYQKGVKKTDAGWKCVEYDVTNVSKIYVTGIGKLYRDFVTGFKNGVYVKSLYQENQQETYRL